MATAVARDQDVQARRLNADSYGRENALELDGGGGPVLLHKEVTVTKNLELSP